ncbi:hypothetical protein [Lacipirellula sp.]|uniref:hypothetical protein n=1 Tax=Lacipirellula sp. TaxID=2691419 RepID=UPI003D1304D3
MKWLFAAIAVVTLIVVGNYATPEAAVALVFGWTSFMARVLPQVRVYWPTIIMGVTAFVLFTFGLHWFLKQFRASATSAVEASPQRWKFRWTAAIVAMVIVAFAAGIAMVGIVHQVGWLANSKASLTETAIEPYFSDQTEKAIPYAAQGLEQYLKIYSRFPDAAHLRDGQANAISWETMILPFAAYVPISREGIDMQQPWNAPSNQKYFKCIIPDFINPELSPPALFDDEGYGLNNYSANSRLVDASKLIRTQPEDGSSSTILLGEVNADFSPWGRPNNVRDPAAGINRGPGTFGGPPNRGGAYFSMADGSVRLIAEDVDPAVLKALSTPVDGDEPSSKVD